VVPFLLSRELGTLNSKAVGLDKAFFFVDRMQKQTSKIGHSQAVLCCLFVEQMMLTGSDDGLLKLWCKRTGCLLRTVRGHEAGIADIQLTPDQRMLMVVSGARLYCYDTAPLRLRWVLAGHAQDITSLCITPRGDRAFTTSLDGSCLVWPLHGHEACPEPTLLCKERKAMWCSAMSPGGTLYVTGRADGMVLLYSATDMCLLQTIDCSLGTHHRDRDVTQILWNGTGSMLLTCCNDGALRTLVWSPLNPNG